MDIKQLAVEITEDQFTELQARFYIYQAREADSDGDVEFVAETAGWIATQGQFDNTEVPMKIMELLETEPEIFR